jgi:FixJ family two-component response regulator
MTEPSPTVFIVDDDSGVLKALSRLVRAAGYDVRVFASPAEFLLRHDSAIPGCVVLDVSMPGMDGVQVQSTLAADGVVRPIVFITGHRDVRTTVTAMKAGAVDFLAKPVDGRELLGAIAKAIKFDADARQAKCELSEIEQRVTMLTPREREVLTHVVAGRLNKQIAGDLGTVEKTIKVHRGRVMAKLGVRTVVDLVRMADRAGIRPWA